jgi:signal transduction histidine kinase
MQRTFLTQIGKSAEKLGEMTSQILDIRSAESNTLQIQISEQDVVPIVMRSVEAFRKDADTKQIHLIYESEIKTATALCNRDYLKLVLDNLLSNAIKFSPFGSIVKVHTALTPEEVQILVTDEGPGIRPDELPKLFGRFQRLSAQPTGGEKSTGLGLSIAKKYVETMNGRIWVASEPGKGATFAVAFPLPQPS